MIKKFNSRFEIFNCIGHSSSNTHMLKPMEQLFSYCKTKMMNKKHITIDPFSRSCLWGDKRNDINPKYLHEYTTHCMDALEFLKNENSTSIDIVILDPPFSDRQSDEEYGTNNLYANPKYMSDLGKEIFRVLKPGGMVLKCGFNSNPPAKGFDLLKINLAQFGASRNDIIFSLWVKNQTVLNVGLNS